MICRTLWLAAVLAVAAGCHESKPAPTGESLKARLDAALALTDPFQKDAALAPLAEDAAAAGDDVVTAGAVDAIGDPHKQDAARAACAPKLAKAGKGAEAVAIAKEIKDPHKRDAVLADLAKGQ